MVPWPDEMFNFGGFETQDEYHCRQRINIGFMPHAFPDSSARNSDDPTKIVIDFHQSRMSELLGSLNACIALYCNLQLHSSMLNTEFVLDKGMILVKNKITEMKNSWNHLHPPFQNGNGRVQQLLENNFQRKIDEISQITKKIIPVDMSE